MENNENENNDVVTENLSNEQILEQLQTPENEVLDSELSDEVRENKEVPPKAKKKMHKGWLVVIIVASVILGCCLISALWNAAFNSIEEKTASFGINLITGNDDDENIFVDTSFDGTVAVLHIEGTIQEENNTYNQEWLLDTIEDLTYSNYGGIMLYINSPGGGVYESDEVYLALEEYKEITENPIWAYFGPLAASGGYYIGCAADTIYANRNTLTGSIGVIFGQSFDFTGFFDKHGIKMTTITAGDNKNMMNIDSPVTQEHRDIMQSIADECYDQFTSIVADAREMDIGTVKKLADGRIYTAKQAQENGLLDEICSFEDALEDFQEFTDSAFSVPEHFMYEYEADFSSLFFEAIDSVKKASQGGSSAVVESITNELALPQGMDFPAYYYKH